MSVTLTDEQAKNGAASLRNLANLLDPPATTPTPPSTPIPPATNYPNFQLIFDEQLTKDCAEGQALSVYGDRFFFYPATWDDTSNKGLYDPGIFPVSNGIANIRMRIRDGRPRVCAPEPKINGATADRNQLYGRYEVRFRADSVDVTRLRSCCGRSQACGPETARSTSPKATSKVSSRRSCTARTAHLVATRTATRLRPVSLTGTPRSSSGSRTSAGSSSMATTWAPRRAECRTLRCTGCFSARPN